MEKALYDSYAELLKTELIPALGCTEPIALAYAAAKAGEVLGTSRSGRKCCAVEISLKM